MKDSSRNETKKSFFVEDEDANEAKSPLIY